jgi:hypothetical protein
LSLEAPTRHAAAGMTALDRAKRGRAALDALLASLEPDDLKPVGG